MGDLPRVQCIVVDADTVRYGASNFVRERTCHDKNGNNRDMGFECVECEQTCPHIYDGTTGTIASPYFCPGCGAKVVELDG